MDDPLLMLRLNWSLVVSSERSSIVDDLKSCIHPFLIKLPSLHNGI